MGMDYCYAGSASYPRFDEELTKVAAVFGGKPLEYLEDLMEDDGTASFVDYMFGTTSRDRNAANQNIVFPEGTDPILVRFFNEPYHHFTPEETDKIWEAFEKHPETKEISNQIYTELYYRYIYQEGWCIT